jgi:hypothetical protein
MAAPSDRAQVEAVSRELTNRYQMMPLLAEHYLAPAALRQKLQALSGRTVTQARDVFDLALLFPRLRGELDELRDLAPSTDDAVARILALTYDDFAGQVVAYLPRDEQRTHDSPDAWEALQLAVIADLESIPK